MIRHLQIVLLTVCFAGLLGAQDSASELLIVGNGDVAAELIVSNVRQPITGRVSFEAILTNDKALVQAFNLAFFNVPQKPLAGNVPVVRPLGVLGFTTIPGQEQPLLFDPEEKRISGTLQLNGDASFLIALANSTVDGEDDMAVAPDLRSAINVNIQLVNDVPHPFDTSRTMIVVADLKLSSTAESFRQFKVNVIGRPSIRIEVGALALYKSDRRLCVQPVNLQRGGDQSGAGLAFGSPGADTQWAKADVVFDYREWITIPAGRFWKLKENEAPDLLDEVDEADCIEIFFVYEFDPPGLWGGGKTWAIGDAGAKIISTDGNARNPQEDFTHLAHELGHVLSLIHPRQISTEPLVAGSTNTLMCPSGYKNDNPPRNSRDNDRNARNPLLTFSLKRRTPAHDCANDTDCGPCR